MAAGVVERVMKKKHNDNPKISLVVVTGDPPCSGFGHGQFLKNKLAGVNR